MVLLLWFLDVLLVLLLVAFNLFCACGGRGAWCRLGGNGGVFMLRVGVCTCNVD